MTSLKGYRCTHGQYKTRKRGSVNLLDACLVEGPQMVTRCGAETAVLVPVQEWRRVQSAARPFLMQLLLSDQARSDMPLAPRGKAKRRPVVPVP